MNSNTLVLLIGSIGLFSLGYTLFNNKLEIIREEVVEIKKDLYEEELDNIVKEIIDDIIDEVCLELDNDRIKILSNLYFVSVDSDNNSSSSYLVL